MPEAPATPTPPPPLLLAAVSPSSVYAGTEDFTAEVTGDRFTPAVRITVDGGELPTRFVSPQQLSATMPAAMIANAGARQVIVRSPDGKLYSNETAFNVNPAAGSELHLYRNYWYAAEGSTRRSFRIKVAERFLTPSVVTF